LITRHTAIHHFVCMLLKKFCFSFWWFNCVEFAYNYIYIEVQGLLRIFEFICLHIVHVSLWRLIAETWGSVWLEIAIMDHYICNFYSDL
jgi:hypothetical protein